MAFLLKYISNGNRFTKFSRRYSSSPIIFSEEVRQAKSAGKPIVALESTIITHGMPYPQNLETAKQVEDIIRKQGAVPATVAILKGQLTIGLTADQLQYLSQAKGVVKASRRDLAPVAAAKLDGATTVAGTIIAAELADIPIFVTGGIGGVHREGETTMDISADLNELGRSRTLVVCSGVKSILDIGRTLEYLESQGVCVCAFGETHDFPAFYTTRSGYRAPHRVSDSNGAAQVLHASHALGLSSGILIAVPVPQEHAMEESKIEAAINKALDDAKQQKIQGKEVTPFILAAVAKATGGASLEANIALIKNNAKVGAEIAVEYKRVQTESTKMLIGFGKPFESRRYLHTRYELPGGWVETHNEDMPLFPPGHEERDVLVIGGANVDRTYRTTENVHLDGSTHPCKADQCAGGVGRNIAEALWRLRGGRTRLLTAVGNDADGQYLANIAPGLLLDGCIVKNARTSTYAALLDPKGECLLGLGDMTLHNHITIDLVNKHMGVLQEASLVVIDGNVPQSTMEHVLQVCHSMKKPVFFEPTDRRKAANALKIKQSISYSSPNLNELRAMALFLIPNASIKKKDDLDEVLQLAAIVSKSIDFIIVTLGAKGVVTIRNSKYNNCLLAKLYPVKVVNDVENVSGAGDCFTSGFICGMLSNYSESYSVHMGFESAKSALFCKNTVPTDLSAGKITLTKAECSTYKMKIKDYC